MAAEGILANGVTEILKGLSIFVAKEIVLATSVKEELQKLKKTIDMILAVMVDAEKKQVKSEAVRMWLKELKDIAYEAEDILDEHAYEVIRQRQMTRKRDQVSKFFSSSNPILFRQQLAHQIKDINKKLKEHAMQKEILGLEMLQLGPRSGPMDLAESSKLRELRETDSIVDQSFGIIGRDKDKSNIINLLLHNDPQNQQDGNIQVIPIVGMGGLGKTALAKSIFNDDTVEKYFDLKMWVCVSDDFVVKKLFMKIIESITGKKCDDVSNIDIIARQLRQHLSRKKYLLVLDDVWNENPEEWARLRTPLLVGGNGSKIIVTTRKDKVASIMGVKHNFYKLRILDDEQSWSLFHERTFGYSGGAVETPTLTVIGKELVKKCGGLPLAIIFLISMLRNKNEDEWRVINQNEIWDQDEPRILPTLKLSYDHLPSHLKQCFSYFSLFPKDYLFNRVGMILFWMAEGFLPQSSRGNNKSMKELGNEYLNSLLRNSFFQDVEKDDIGQVVWFKMHDLVHDLATYVAGDRECLVLAVHENMETIPNVRRLTLINSNAGMSKTICKALHNQPKLRTLLVVDQTMTKVENNTFDGLKRLRVLDLSDAPNIEEILPSSMSKLKYLRYLDLSNTKIINLPESVMKLYHLRTLRLNDCVNLKELPTGIEKLINLRHLVLPDEINMPREVGQLSSLRTLVPINVSNAKGGCGIQVLEGLSLLNGEIVINHLRNVTSEIHAQRANLKGKENLNQIYLNWHTEDDDVAREDNDGEYDKDEEEAVLEALQPHPNLKLLVIDQYFGARLPWWMGDPSCLSTLVALHLSKCKKCEQLVGFGKLPSLKVLELLSMDGIKCLGNEFYSSNCGGGGGEVVLFPSLKELVLQDMGSLEEWVGVSSYSSCFPCLEKIKIISCPNLRITPTRFPSLKKLTLEEINERVAVPIITTNLNSLLKVHLENISELRFLPLRLLQGTSLGFLKVSHCLDFQGFASPEIDHQNKEEEGFSSLGILALRGLPNLKFLPDIRSFTSLEGLVIKDCESFKSLPEDLTCLSSSLEHLEIVHIQNVKEVEVFEWQK